MSGLAGCPGELNIIIIFQEKRGVYLELQSRD
jgi:hypothetical protein